MMFWRRRTDPGIAAVLLRLREDLAAERAARAFAMQRMAEMKLEHARELEDLRRRMAIAQANFEWLSVSHNKIDAERSQLMAVRLGMNAPPMNIETRVVAGDYGTGIPREEARERPYADNRVPGVGDLAAQGLSFDDVGDREARAIGLDGGVVYDNPSSLL